MATYVCSDIHGRYDRFLALLDKIDFKDTDELYILGDVIDRNDGGIEILKYIMEKENIHLLMGNHEIMMLNYLNYGNTIWMYPSNGGNITYSNYIKESTTRQKQIKDYLSNLPYIVVVTVGDETYHLSHSGTTKHVKDKSLWMGDDLTDTEKDMILWMTPYRDDLYLPMSYYCEDYIYLLGHVPVQRIVGYDAYEMYPNRNIVDIDCGCALSMQEEDNPERVKTALGCLRLDDCEEFYITEEDIYGIGPKN